MPQLDIVDRFKVAQDSLVIQQSDFSLSAISEMVRRGAIDVSPHYQRRDRWPPEKQSALIESFLLNVPVPPIYLSEDEYGRYSVIDGKQRVTAIRDFLDDTLKLRDLRRFPELEGLRFRDLPMQLQNALTVRPYIRVTTLLKQSDENLKYEVFLRLNTGGDLLKPQEVRNVAYSGPLNDLLFKLAEHPFLKNRLKITGDKSAAYRNMEDVEHVLRFFTLHERWQATGGSLSDAMDDFMARHRYKAPTNMENLFVHCLEICNAIWRDCAFQKPVGAGWRDQLISPLFDAEMIGVSLLTASQLADVLAQRDAVVSATHRLFSENQAFSKSVTQGTNTSSAVRTRVTAIWDLLKGFAEL